MRKLNENLAQGGVWTTLEDGRLLWQRAVQATGAESLRLHLTDLNLPAGAELYLSAPEGRAYGPFNGKGPLGTGEIWANEVRGETTLIELLLPRKSARPVLVDGNAQLRPPFAITEVLHRYAPFRTKAQLNCHEDVSCIQDWDSQAAAVGQMFFIDGGLGYICSGTLLNSNAPSPKPGYFLTSNICIPNNTVAQTLEVTWLYRTSSCNGSAPSNSPTTLGATYLEGRSFTAGTDFAFLEINGSLPAGTVLAGWTNSDPVTGPFSTVGLHHPDGDPTRITVFETASLGASFNAGSANSAPVFYRMDTDGTFGSMEGGSDGAGIFRNDPPNGQIIGHQSASTQTCVGQHYVGRFRDTYPLISQWLQPSAPTNTPTPAGPTNTPTPSACIDDRFEPNDDCASSADPGFGVQSGLQVCSGDDDWFRFNVSASAQVTFSISFTHANGDLDLEVYSACGGTLLDESAGTSDLEEVVLTGATEYSVKVLGFQGAENSYTLTATSNSPATNTPVPVTSTPLPGTNTPTPSGCSDDAQEPNDTCGAARSLAFGNYPSLQVCPNNQDWYRFTASSPADTVTFTINFAHASGDLDLRLFTACGATPVQESLSTDNQEQVSGSGSTEYLLFVEGYLGASNSYSLTADTTSPVTNTPTPAPPTATPTPGGGCPDDQYEDNDTCATAAPLAPGTYTLQACDSDWFTFTANPSDTVTAEILFTHADQDLDLYLEGTCGTVLAFSESTTDDETVTFSGESVYRMEVFPYSGAPGPYTLALTVGSPATSTPTPRPTNTPTPVGPTATPTPGGCSDDVFEPNDACASPAQLSPGTYRRMQVCDDDWYQINANPADTVTFRAEFDHGLGDLDLAVRAVCSGPDLAVSNSSTDNESITRTGESVYYLHVYGYQGAQNGYDLFIEVDSLPTATPTNTGAPTKTPTPIPTATPTATPCFDDNFEDNDVCAAARSMVQGVYNPMQLCDEDWYEIAASPQDVLTVSINFAHSGGDLDLAVYANCGDPTPLGISESDNDNETVAVSGRSFYRVHVYGFQGAVNTYELSLRLQLQPTATPTIPGSTPTPKPTSTPKIPTALPTDTPKPTTPPTATPTPPPTLQPTVTPRPTVSLPNVMLAGWMNTDASAGTSTVSFFAYCTAGAAPLSSQGELYLGGQPTGVMVGSDGAGSYTWSLTGEFAAPVPNALIEFGVKDFLGRPGNLWPYLVVGQ